MAHDNCLRLFNVSESFEITQEEFKILWPLVTNIWTQFSSGSPMKGDEWTVYACHLLKHCKSSTRQEDVESGKRRKTNIREAQLCPVKIQITKVSSSETVRIEPFGLNPAIHTHSIDDCDMFKKSQALRDLITEEASKSYQPPDITISVKELAKTTLGERSGVDYLKTKDVASYPWSSQHTSHWEQ